MNWVTTVGIIIAVVFFYLIFASSRNRRDARSFFDFGYERGQAGERMTDEELGKFDPLQLVAFDSGFDAGRYGKNPDEAFDYDWIKQTVKKGFQRGVF